MQRKRRYIFLFLTYKNLQLKYKHSALGFVWSLLHPFLYLVIFMLIFSNAFPFIENYSLYALSGLVFWVFFSGATHQLCQVFIKNSFLIKSLNLPKTYYAYTEMGSEIISFLLSLIPFMILMYFMGLKITWSLLYIIPVIILFAVFTFSVGLVLGSLNVFLRDIGIFWNTINPALFYLSPIAFSYEIVPDKFRPFLLYNPLYYFFGMVRNVLYESTHPSASYTLICAGITLITALLAVFVYRKTRNGFISNL